MVTIVFVYSTNVQNYFNHHQSAHDSLIKYQVFMWLFCIIQEKVT